MTQDDQLDPFKTFIRGVIALDTAHWDQIARLTRIVNFKKKALFHAEGKRCKTVGFILIGCFRSVKNFNGENRTFDFAVENEFITDYYSVLKKTPSQFNILAMEDSVVACMDAAALFRLIDSDPAWQKFGRLMAEQASCYYQERLLSAFFDPPQERYARLTVSWPDVIQRVPQHIIANYLGVTKETLSRIRKKAARRPPR